MTARCSTCAINYPSHIYRCRVCDGPLDDFANDKPHDDWQARVQRLLDGDTPQKRSTAEQVEDWRLEELLKAGYDLEAAERLSKKPWHEVDLHLAVELVTQRGCPLELAVAILA